MSIVARRFRATPTRTATEVWDKITGLICKDDELARKDFAAVGGIAAPLIASEAFKSKPLVIAGSGPKLRVYCLYDEDAIVANGSNEDELSWKPTESSWKAFLPCHADDLAWVSRALKSKATRFQAYDVAEDINEETPEDRTAGLRIDKEKFNQA